MSFGSLVWSIWNRTPSANGTGINVGNSRKNEAQNPGRKWHEPFCLWLFVVVQGYWWLLVVVCGLGCGLACDPCFQGAYSHPTIPFLLAHGNKYLWSIRVSASWETSYYGKCFVQEPPSLLTANLRLPKRNLWQMSDKDRSCGETKNESVRKFYCPSSL